MKHNYQSVADIFVWLLCFIFLFEEYPFQLCILQRISNLV